MPIKTKAAIEQTTNLVIIKQKQTTWNHNPMDAKISHLSSNEICLYPDEILEAYKLIEPSGFIKIRGQVTRLYPSGKHVYGDMKGQNHTISFRCPKDKCPKALNENVILAGSLSVRPAKIHHGLEVMLYGEVAGHWEGFSTNELELIIPERTTSKLLLDAYIQKFKGDISKLLVLGSKRGLIDYKAPISQNAKEIYWEEIVVNVNEDKKFLNDLQTLTTQKEFNAIAIVRGGSDSSRSLQMWNDAGVVKALLETKCPVYSAIGHDDGFVYLDQFADQSFISPSDFGHCIVNSLNLVEENEKQNQKYQSIDDENESLNENLIKLKNAYEEKLTSTNQQYEANIKQLNARIKKWMLVSALIFSGALLTGFLLYN